MKTEATPMITEFKFNCPTCGQHILVATQWIGLGISCPSCQSRISVPQPLPEPSSAALAAPPKHSGQTIRIELPLRTSQAPAGVNGTGLSGELDSMVTPKPMGNEPWPEMVRRLEKGELVTPAELATALFHELMAVRRRLDWLESRTAKE